MFTFRATEDLPPMTWCLRFDAASFLEWKQQFTIRMWEGKNRSTYTNVKAEEQRYIQDAYEDVEMRDVENEEEEEEEVASEEEGSADETEEEDEAESSHAFAQGSKNQHLAVGYKDDLSFVTRGDMIGVFAQKDDRIRFRTTIDRIKDLQGNSLAPEKVRDLGREWTNSRSCFTTRTGTCSYWILNTKTLSCGWTWSMAKSSMNGRFPTAYRLQISSPSMSTCTGPY